MKIRIPVAVLEHWNERLDEIGRFGVTQPTDRTYVKILAAKNSGSKIVRIDAETDDLAELEAECANWLDDETDVSVGRDPEDRRLRSAYQRLREAVVRSSA